MGPRPIRLSLVVLLDKLQNKRVDILGVRRTQEVLSILNSLQLRIGAVDEHLDLLLGVGDRVDCVTGTVDPQNLGAPVSLLSSPSIGAWCNAYRATDVGETIVETVAVREVDRGHTSALAAVGAAVVALHLLVPEFPEVGPSLGVGLSHADRLCDSVSQGALKLR